MEQQSDSSPKTGDLLDKPIVRRSFLKGGLGAFVYMLSVTSCGTERALVRGLLPSDAKRPSSSPNLLGIDLSTGYYPSGRPITETVPADERVPILWIEAGVCTGCAVSLLASVNTPIESLLPSVRIEFQETLMDLSGEAALTHLQTIASQWANKYILIVDGSIPTGKGARTTCIASVASGDELTAEQLIKQLATSARVIIALGTCSSFGGIPAAGANPFACQPLQKVLPSQRVINIPGCPPHPDWIITALGAVLQNKALKLDPLGRPTDIFGQRIHDLCRRRPYYERQEFAAAPGDPVRCLFRVGCKGPRTRGDCPVRNWNDASHCLAVNHPCLGCTCDGFPDPLPDIEA